MSCEIKNEKCPFEIECSFPTATNDTRHFHIYFLSSQGSQEQVVSCAYNGHGKCFPEDGFNITHEAYNSVTITVPDTFATRKGSFVCQMRDIPMVKNCSYPPPEICDIITSTQSGIDLGTTTKDDNTSIVIGVAFGVVVVILILILGIVLFMRQRKNKHKRSTDESSENDGVNGIAFKWSRRYNDGPSVSIREECNNLLLERESTGTHDDQIQIDLPSATVEIRPESLINGSQQVSTVGEETATGDQENTYPHKISGANRALPINQL
ncbi:uncharacterized protein LOC112569680 [Pomacea canaliculata]|uniref:uncharacterized protein LOC112569680 n=1 Tax=Pomacea canaliculata TaxID=400727 RepID=UPI000D737B04|nr:uncharacterized protein LOC112569680 [Pomacea canaliculata]